MVVDDEIPSLSKVVNNYGSFGKPPNVSERKEYFGKSLIKKFKEQFSTMSWNIPHYAVASFHTILGALPDVRNIKIRVGNNYEDCRVHTFLLMESGAGKGGGFGYSHTIADKLGLHFRATGELTNASICGTIEEGKKDERGEVIPGYLHPNFDGGNPVDIFASSEASQIVDIENSYFDKTTITNLQRCMNRLGTVDNRLEKKLGSSHRIIEFNTSASLYFTSYPPERLFKTITKTGLLQRMIVLYVPVTLRDKLDVGLKHAKLLEDDTIKDIEDGMKEIVDALKYINEFYRNVDRLTLTKKAKDVLIKHIIPSFFKPLIKVDTDTMHELKKFTTRYQVITYKLAWHHAISRLSKKVEVQDMAYAKAFMMPVFNSLIAFMENEYQPSKQQYIKTQEERKIIKNIYKVMSKKYKKKNPWILGTVMIEALEKRANITTQASRHMLSKHHVMFERNKDKKGRKVMRLRKNVF
ncbi:hypothetical protein AKJ51_04015 [candidate division MSBL1 archaeon SCGC-AAA382A20]|uniref:DUF3987 domain-containing protein n=1 Tax=candidate division MSBL1 archaeon SCGC-AAA382A20 TaxID=1698280 RepID=A0A133VIG3_9EURY|nr:hypothetical protein AKJ51_04015 [candidate division MSBL1 archaeon SCGC-AAA382A20]